MRTARGSHVRAVRPGAWSARLGAVRSMRSRWQDGHRSRSRSERSSAARWSSSMESPSRRSKTKAIEDKERARGVLRELGPASLAPVPPPARDPQVVAPDDLAGRGVFQVGAVAAGIERLVPGRDGHAQRTSEPIGILAAQWHDVADADRVVGVDQRVHARQRLSLQDPADERFRGARIPARLGAEGAERPTPGDDVRVVVAFERPELRRCVSAAASCSSLPASVGPLVSPEATSIRAT